MDVDADEHLDRYAGLPVVEFESGDPPAPGERVAWRVRTDYGPPAETEEFTEVFDRFLATVDTTAVTHLILGYWGPGYEVSSAVPRQLLLEAAPRLPNLRTLDLWLGTEERDGMTDAADLAGILSGERLPALTRLGLMNSEIQDEICAAVATAPVVAQLSELALSMGMLTDDGAEALLSGQPLTHLVELDLRHHFLTAPMVARLRAALSPVKVLLIDTAQDNHDDGGELAWYVAVGE